jgi:aquaporin Z
MAGVTAAQEADIEGGAPTSRGAVAGRKYAVELIGTFLLVFTVVATTLGTGTLGPLAVGAVILALVYAGGHISGAHYNPAITLAVLVRGRLEPADAVAYWVVQLAGGVLGALLARWVINPAQVTTLTLSGHLLAAALVAELLFTFALCYVVVNVATSQDHPVNSFYGMAIGFTVAAGAVAVGGVSGAAFNPAVTLGLDTTRLFAWSTLWVYLVAQVAAGIAAGLAFRTLNPTDK